MNTKNKPIPLVINDNKELHAHYMPFIQSGAIFVPTTAEYELGDTAIAHVMLKQVGKKIPIHGKVAWITPTGQAGVKAGIGIQFSGANAGKIKQFIEKMLGTLLNVAPTNTVY